jgi:hypothetical protein
MMYKNLIGWKGFLLVNDLQQTDQNNFLLVKRE